MAFRVPLFGQRFRALDSRLYRGIVHTIVPTLEDARKMGQLEAHGEAMEHNPFLFYPAWKLGMRLGALGIQVSQFEEPDGDASRHRRAEIRARLRHGLRAHDMSDLERHPSPEHISQAILDSPNPHLTRPLLIAGTVATMLAYRRSVWVKERDDAGRVVALWPVPGHVLYVEKNEREIIDHYEARYGSEVIDRFPCEDVCDFRLMPGVDDWADGLSPFDSLSTIAEFGMNAMEGLADVFNYGILSRVYVNLNGKTLEEGDEEAADRLGAQLAKVRLNKGEIPVMEDGATIDTMGDAVNTQVMHDALDRSTMMIDKMFSLDKQDPKEFYGEAVQPIADAIEHELDRSYFSEWADEGIFFGEFAFREAMKGSPAERINMHQTAIMSMQETPNEARRDEGREEIAGPADELWGPLNLSQLSEMDSTDERRPRDTLEGMGGDEGKGTLLSLPTGPQVAEPRRSTRLAKPWERTRDRIVASQAEALARRVKAHLRGEAKGIRRRLEARSVRAAKTEVGLPNLDELYGELGITDEAFARLLRTFMAQAGNEAWKAAEDLVGATRAAMEQALAEAFTTRSAVVAERFLLARREELAKLFSQAISQGWRTTDLANAIATRWEELSLSFADSISRTEMAWATERSALSAWRTAGIRMVEFVFGGGPCTTGVCEDAALGGPYELGTVFDAVTGSFDGVSSPPLHPSCTCLLVPSVSPGLAVGV